MGLPDPHCSCQRLPALLRTLSPSLSPVCAGRQLRQGVAPLALWLRPRRQAGAWAVRRGSLAPPWVPGLLMTPQNLDMGAVPAQSDDTQSCPCGLGGIPWPRSLQLQAACLGAELSHTSRLVGTQSQTGWGWVAEMSRELTSQQCPTGWASGLDGAPHRVSLPNVSASSPRSPKSPIVTCCSGKVT